MKRRRLWPLRNQPAGPGSEPSSPLPAPAEAPKGPERPDDTRDGAVEVRAGKVLIRRPTGHGRWPSITLAEGCGLEATVNGQPVSGDVVLRDGDLVELHGAMQEVPSRVEVRVAGDEMEAFVTALPGERITVSVPDVAAATQIALAGLEVRERLSCELTRADIAAALKEAGVQAGLDLSALDTALASPGTEVRVARGHAPRTGSPSTVWSFLEGELTSPPGSAATPEPEWARARPFAAIGQPVIQIKPGNPGAPGETVTGRQLAVPTVWLPELSTGSGALLSSDGWTAIAARSGHPEVVFEGQRIFVAVYPERQVSGSVDDGTGDISFDGDVWIGGDVQPRRLVQAAGTIEVRGRVIRATLVAGGSIRVHGGVVNSLLASGGPGIIYAQAMPLCEEALGYLVQLEALPASRDQQVAVSQVRRVAGRLRTLFGESEMPVDAEVFRVAGSLMEALRNDANQLGTGQIRSATAALRAAVGRMRQTIARPGSCYVHHLDNSRVEASGNVVVTAPGAYRSHVVTLGSLHAAGCFRGGSAWAARGAHFAAVGSSTEVSTRVEVSPSATFRADEVHAGTVVVRGRDVRQFDVLSRDVVI